MLNQFLTIFEYLSMLMLRKVFNNTCLSVSVQYYVFSSMYLHVFKLIDSQRVAETFIKFSVFELLLCTELYQSNMWGNMFLNESF